MSSRTQRPVSRRSAITVFYLLAIGSGIFRSLSVTFDVFALNTSPAGPLAYGFMAQWLSLVATFVAVAALSIKKKSGNIRRPLGYHLDPDFGRLRMLPKTPLLYLFIAGLLGGVSTFFYYLLIGQTNASTVLPYGQLVIIYLLVGDLLSEKDTPTIVEVQCLISIMFGVLLVGVTPGGFDIPSLLIVLGPMNVFSAIYTYYQKKVKSYELEKGLKVDSLNMRLWTLIFLNISMTVMMLPLMTPSTWEVIALTFMQLFWIMIASSITIFISMVMYVRALGKGTMAVVNSISAVSVILGIPITIIGNSLIPGAFGVMEDDVFLWILRILGVILVMIGVIALQAADVRSLVFIKVKPHTEDLLPELFSIRGVKKAAAIAGDYDYILTLKSRSLTKTRSMILKRIQMIPEIEHVETLVVIKDYR